MRVMPYIITTGERGCGSPCDDEPDRPACELVNVSRRAVATLDEARDHVADSLPAMDPNADLPWFPESGGTIGPLPDGTVIEVAVIHLGELNRATPEDRRDNPHRCEWSERTRRIIDAYNAAQETGR